MPRKIWSLYECIIAVVEGAAIVEHEMGGTCSTHRTLSNAYTVAVGNPEVMSPRADQRVHRRIISK
jgi:hypothetical protein